MPSIEQIKRTLLGAPEKIPQRVLTAGLLVSLAVSIGGLWLLATSGLETASTGSLTYLRPILELATSTWVYVLLLAWIARRILTHRDQQYAEQAAEVTGYEPRSVRRLAYESKSPDGTTRVIASSEDDAEEIRERILEKLDAEAEDDVMKLNPEAFAEPSPEDDFLEDGNATPANRKRRDQLEIVLGALEEKQADLHEELDATTDDVLRSRLDPKRIREALESGDDRHAPADLLADEGREALDGADELLEQAKATGELREEVLEEVAGLSAKVQESESQEPVDTNADADAGLTSRVADAAGRAVSVAKVGLATVALTVLYHAWLVVAATLPESIRTIVPLSVRIAAHTAPAYGAVALLAALLGLAWAASWTADDQLEVDAETGEVRDPWLEQYKLFRLDLASTLNFSRLVWQFALPAALTVAALLIVVQIWVAPILYVPLLAAGMLVGGLNYFRVSWKRSRRLAALREEREAVDWSDVSILVKEVDLPEARVQYGWVGDRRFAHDDREEFADEVALRAYELVNGVQVSPSVLEKQASQLEQLQPDLHGFRDVERERIMTRLIEAVRESQHGLVPKAALIEQVVEHDLEPRRWGPGRRGRGHDPELVREAYRELVPAALVEQEIELDEDGEETLTAVRHRGDPLPPGYGQIRAQFSSQFGNYARWDPLYELPDVSDRLEAEPEYASTVGVSA